MTSHTTLLTIDENRLAPAVTTPEAAAWGDWIGVVASIGCAIHCAAMPFVIAYLPMLGLSFLADEAFHKWMAVACFAIAVAAFIPGFRRHGRLRPVAIASVGLAMISTAAFGLAGECCPSCAGDDGGDLVAAASAPSSCTDAGCPHCVSEQAATVESEPPAATPMWLASIAPWLTPLGGMVLVSAHLLNRRYGCLCGCCEEPSADNAAAATDVGEEH